MGTRFCPFIDIHSPQTQVVSPILPHFYHLYLFDSPVKGPIWDFSERPLKVGELESHHLGRDTVASQASLNLNLRELIGQNKHPQNSEGFQLR